VKRHVLAWLLADRLRHVEQALHCDCPSLWATEVFAETGDFSIQQEPAASSVTWARGHAQTTVSLCHQLTVESAPSSTFCISLFSSLRAARRLPAGTSLADEVSEDSSMEESVETAESALSFPLRWEQRYRTWQYASQSCSLSWNERA